MNVYCWLHGVAHTSIIRVEQCLQSSK